MHGVVHRGVVVVVVCRGVLCLVLCVVCGVVDGCIICVVFRGILYWVLCLVLCVVWRVLTSALERFFSLCLFARGFLEKPLRGFLLCFLPSEASLFCWFFCVFCPGFSHDI